MHLSAVIDYIEYLEGKRDLRNGGLSKAGHNYAVNGFAWERVLQNVIERDPTELWEWMFGRALAEPNNPKVIRPGEQCVDGIYLTPDGYHIDDMVLEEWKWTTKSSKGGIEGNKKFRRWTAFQIPAYLYALNLDICRLRVHHARGDYTTGEPEWWEHILSYTRQEIVETWDCICMHADLMYKGGLVH